jgi:hypothetical protein
MLSCATTEWPLAKTKIAVPINTVKVQLFLTTLTFFKYQPRIIEVGHVDHITEQNYGLELLVNYVQGRSDLRVEWHLPSTVHSQACRIKPISKINVP